MKIRSPHRADLAALTEIHAKSFAREERWNEKMIEGSLALPTTEGFVAEEAGEVVGFLLAQRVMGEAEILTVCVTPLSRGQGIGAALVRATLDLSGVSCVFLEVAADNEPAQHLYERCGFEVFGMRPDYYKRDGRLVDAVTYRFMVKS